MSTILVVDDDVEVTQLLETFLEFEGLNVVTAHSGTEALGRLHKLRPALILLDLMMPVMDGVEFRRHQAADPMLRTIPVVCMSARHDARQTAARLGLAGFVGKPFDLDQVIAVVRRWCPA